MLSKYQKQANEALERRAIALYKTGLPLRIVGEEIGRSHQWVKQAVDKYEALGEEAMNTVAE